jgi:hypothetical protein
MGVFMRRRLARIAATATVLSATILLLSGCTSRHLRRNPSPAASGLNVRDVIDPEAQPEGESALGTERYLETVGKAGAQIRAGVSRNAPAARPERNVLCLSGGGSNGSFIAGMLAGWSARGDRPQFDVVTGVSTGALIAPFVFLGPQYDALLAEFYTTSTNRDIFRTHYLRGLLGGESFMSTAPLRRKIAEFITPGRMAEIAAAHRSGRRLVLGTTEMEGKRLVLWDIGAIACGNRPCDRDLIIDVMLGSAAIPGAFPAAKIDVWIDGKRHTERHVDGGVSRSLFFYAPYLPPEERTGSNADLAGVNVYAIVAGKLFADPEIIRPTAVSQGAKAIFTLTFAQARSDLVLLWNYCVMSGMTFNLAAIPPDYPRPQKSGTFDPEEMKLLYETGRRLAFAPEPWRTTPPGMDPSLGELDQTRAGRDLVFQPRGPEIAIPSPRRRIAPSRTSRIAIPAAGSSPAN